MRLQSIPFGWYYVVLYAKSGRNLVTNAADVELFLELSRVTLRKKGAELHAGCVTSKEVHLAMRIGDAPVSAITRSLCHEYARRFNREHHEGGGLFRSHAHVLLIQHTLWLVPLAHFIHWIPRLRQPQSGIGEYTWSSDAVYRRRTRQKGLVTHAVLHLLSGGSRRRDVQELAYRERFDKIPDPEHIWLFAHGSPQDPRVLGNPEFTAGIGTSAHQPSPRRKRLEFHDHAVREAVIDVVRRFGELCDEMLPPRRASAWKRTVILENLCSPSRKRPLPMVRAVSASYIIKRDIATRAQVASFFGCRPGNLSAHRRRYYMRIFREWFGAMPGMLQSPGRNGDQGVGGHGDV
jgi:hypothetical protein